jgi:hypothetical protein
MVGLRRDATAFMAALVGAGVSPGQPMTAREWKEIEQRLRESGFLHDPA